ncbi:MAG: twin-arginine translocation signal domain-containing protein [Candidatus Methanosuratincola sp.]
MLTRRDFIKFLSLVGAGTLTPLRRFLRLTSLEEAPHQQEDTGELYADFLLLPEGTAVPNFVQYPKVPMPRLCGVGAESEDTRPDAVIHFFENHEEVARKNVWWSNKTGQKNGLA